MQVWGFEFLWETVSFNPQPWTETNHWPLSLVQHLLQGPGFKWGSQFNSPHTGEDHSPCPRQFLVQ